MFIIGTGNTFALTPPIYLYKGIFNALAAAFATARDTPRIAFAPNFPLLFVPSNSISILSIAVWSNTLHPINSSAIVSLTFLTAFNTLFPW